MADSTMAGSADNDFLPNGEKGERPSGSNNTYTVDDERQPLISASPIVNGRDPPPRDFLADRDTGTSNFGVIMHIIKGNVGTGILAMPAAFSHAGILVGSVGLLFLGIICVHCMHILVNCSHYLCRKIGRPHLDYADVAEHSFRLGPVRLARHSWIARIVVNAFLLVTQFGFCCVYILFVAKNIKLVIQKCIGDDPADKADYKPNYPMRIQVYEVILVVILLPFVFIKNISHLAPFSMIANVASFFGLLVILYYILIFKEINSISRLPLFKGWSELPLYFGTAIYAFEGIGVVLPVENTMRKPRDFPSMFGVLNVGMTIVCVLYMTVGFYGYIEFGNDSQGSVTLNLTSWYGIVVQIVFSLCIFVTFLLQFYVPMNILKPIIASSRLAQRIGANTLDNLLRVLFVVISFAVAAIVDEYLDLLIALIGSVASSALALIIPGILDIVTFWPERHNTKFFWGKVCKDVAIITLGVLGFVFGTIIAIKQLVEKIGKK